MIDSTQAIQDMWAVLAARHTLDAIYSVGMLVFVVAYLAAKLMGARSRWGEADRLRESLGEALGVAALAALVAMPVLTVAVCATGTDDFDVWFELRDRYGIATDTGDLTEEDVECLSDNPRSASGPLSARTADGQDIEVYLVRDGDSMTVCTKGEDGSYVPLEPVSPRPRFVTDADGRVTPNEEEQRE